MSELPSRVILPSDLISAGPPSTSLTRSAIFDSNSTRTVSSRPERHTSRDFINFSYYSNTSNSDIRQSYTMNLNPSRQTTSAFDQRTSRDDLLLGSSYDISTPPSNMLNSPPQGPEGSIYSYYPSTTSSPLIQDIGLPTEHVPRMPIVMVNSPMGHGSPNMTPRRSPPPLMSSIDHHHHLFQPPNYLAHTLGNPPHNPLDSQGLQASEMELRYLQQRLQDLKNELENTKPERLLGVRPLDSQERTRLREQKFCSMNRAGNALCAWHEPRRERRKYPPRMAPPRTLNCGCTYAEALLEESLSRNGVGSFWPGDSESVRMDPRLRNNLLKLLEKTYGYIDGDFERNSDGTWKEGQDVAAWEQRARRPVRRERF